MIVNKDNESTFQATLPCAKKMVQISEALKNIYLFRAFFFYCKVLKILPIALLIKMHGTGENCGALVVLV
jgi:hypothetical protein